MERSTFLFATPSFLTGMARVIDLFGQLDEYNSSPTVTLADYLAMKSDWASVGDDLREAMTRYSNPVGQLPLFEAGHRPAVSGQEVR